ncbi:MAG: hypothetical protein KF893_12945 [Caldilineaceae bacterium]|nr:hypothetical protein [Caldilineaceae bacterium]
MDVQIAREGLVFILTGAGERVETGGQQNRVLPGVARGATSDGRIGVAGADGATQAAQAPAG